MSSESRLLNLVLDAGGGPVALSPMFGSATGAYSATVQSASATITPTAWINDAAITVNGTPVASGSASVPLPLDVGSNTLSVVVTSGDATSTSTYTVTVTRQIIAPAAPTNVQAVLGAPGTGQATVSWTPSASSGSSALVDYTVSGGSGCATSAGGSSCVVSGLVDGTAYTFTVTAANAEGGTATSLPSNSVTPPASCSFNGTLVLHGGSVTAFLSSTVAYGSTCQQQSRTCNNGTLSGSYTHAACSVAAPAACSFNGAPVSHGGSITAFAQSSVPFGSTCQQQSRTCTNGTLSGSYLHDACTVDAPASCTFNGQPVAHGQSVTAYLNAVEPSGSSCTAESRSCSNGVLSGSHAHAACQVAPGAPTNVAATPGAAGSGTVTVSWTAPADNGTAAITSYTATVVGDGSKHCTATGTPPDTHCTVAGLTNGTAYTFTVTATSTAGTSSPSAASSPAVTPKGVQAIAFADPGPQNFGATLTLSATGGASGLPVTFSASGVCTVGAGNVLSFTSAGSCTVTASQGGNAAWAAAAQVAHTFAVNAVAPGAPTGVTATPGGPTQVTVRWTPPASDGGGITLYTVRALVNGVPSGQTCTAAPPATQCTVTGLEPGKTYTFTVEATNGAGGTAAPAPTNPATPLADAKAFSAPAPTGTGTVAVAVAGGGATCAFESVRLLPAASAASAPPANLRFPHGLLDFALNGCDATPVTLTITYPQALPQGVQYWKLRNGAWAAYGNATAVAGTATATLTLQDGGMGDDDGVPTPDGRIVDPGQVAVPAAPGPGGATAIPSLGAWALALLAAVLGLLGGRQRRRTRA